MHLSTLDKSQVEQYLKLIESDESIIGAILHGSSLESDNYQDIDIALISKNLKLSSKEKMHYYLSSPDGFDVRFLQDFPIYIAKDVIKGKLLLNKAYDLVFNQYIWIIQEWELFRPSYELYLDVILNGL
jgi:predicted nucleotidyltransferase